MIKGYLRKENSAGKWQKRWFEVVGRFFVYYKRADSPSMLCAMDLWKAHTPESACHPRLALPTHAHTPTRPQFALVRVWTALGLPRMSSASGGTASAYSAPTTLRRLCAGSTYCAPHRQPTPPLQPCEVTRWLLQLPPAGQRTPHQAGVAAAPSSDS